MLSNLSIKHKSLAAFLAIAVISGASGIIGFVQTQSVRHGIEQGQSLRAEVGLYDRLAALVTEQSLLLKSFVLTGDRGELAKVQAMTGQIEAAQKTLVAAIDDGAETAAMTGAFDSWRSWRSGHLLNVVDLMRTPATIELARLVETSGENIRHLDDFFAKIAQINQSKKAILDSSEVEEIAAANASGVVVLAAAVVVFALSLLLGVINFRLMSRMSATMNAMADGDAGMTVTGAERADEIGAMARAAQAFRTKIDDIEQAQTERAESESRATRERAEMMDRLRASFGEVVNAAIEGDFTRRVDARFDDSALNELAEGVNQLVETVERGVGETTRVAALLAQGDLTASMNGDFRGSFAELKRSLNTSLKRLDELVGEITSGAGDMQRASAEIQNGAEELASRAESQASSLEETAATMEEMTATIRANAESADQARILSGDASTRAERGGDEVQETVQAMSRIEESSSKISEIISVIDGIAFQTNLLALNAAVEAARAGDAGKGFAVVASEVRTLAQRSADAAKDINTLISESTQHVTSGVTLVRRTGDSLTEIVGAVEKVAKTVADISTANREQSSGVDEISNAVSHMDQMTQQNASMAEESANSARSLADHSRQLAEQVQFFKTSRQESRQGAHQVTRSAAAPQASPAAPRPAPAAAPEPSPAANGDWANF